MGDRYIGLDVHVMRSWCVVSRSFKLTCSTLSPYVFMRLERKFVISFDIGYMCVMWVLAILMYYIVKGMMCNPKLDALAEIGFCNMRVYSSFGLLY